MLGLPPSAPRRPMSAGPDPVTSGPESALATSAPLRYSRSMLPSKLPTTCDQLPTASAGPCALLRPVLPRARKLIVPPSRNNRYWVFTTPPMVFSKMPPFSPAALGLIQASTLTPLDRSRVLDAGIVTTAPPAKLAALSPGTAPVASSVTALYEPAVLPTVSAAMAAPASSP